MEEILVIDNHDSFVFNIAQLLRESERHPKFKIVRNEQVRLKDLPRYAGVILSPGPGLPAEAENLLPAVQQCLNTGQPLLGICLGHQAIAQSLGASLTRLVSPLHGHRSLLALTDRGDTLLKDLPEPAWVGRYHSWVVSPPSMPNELSVSSMDEEGHIMSFYHQALPVHGLQFHPESYISNCGKQILENWLAETTNPPLGPHQP